MGYHIKCELIKSNSSLQTASLWNCLKKMEDTMEEKKEKILEHKWVCIGCHSGRHGANQKSVKGEIDLR